MRLKIVIAIFQCEEGDTTIGHASQPTLERTDSGHYCLKHFSALPREASLLTKLLQAVCLITRVPPGAILMWPERRFALCRQVFPP